MLRSRYNSCLRYELADPGDFDINVVVERVRLELDL